MRIVVKVGTSTLAHPGGLLNIRHTEDLVRVWSDIQNAGHQLIVVSSAATGLGAGKLQIEKPGDLVTKQAAAAVGQCELMYTYDRLFGQYNHTVAQMLLTWEDFDHENRLHNLQNTLERLLQLHAIPIINENDPVACEEYSLGDNDTLAALVAKCIHADLVVLMSDIDGLKCTWDFKDRLRFVENDEMRAEYIYDYTDRRIAKKVWNKPAAKQGRRSAVAEKRRSRDANTQTWIITGFPRARERRAGGKV